MLKKAVLLVALVLPIGLGCDNDGTGGSFPPLSANTQGSSVGSLSGTPSTDPSLNASTESSSVGSLSNSGQSASPGALSGQPEGSSGSSSSGGSGGACSFSAKCREYVAALNRFIQRSCAQSEDPSECESLLRSIFGEFEYACNMAATGYSTAELCEALDCAICVFDNVSVDAESGDVCAVSQCASQCRGQCQQESYSPPDSSNSQ